MSSFSLSSSAMIRMLKQPSTFQFQFLTSCSSGPMNIRQRVAIKSRAHKIHHAKCVLRIGVIQLVCVCVSLSRDQRSGPRRIAGQRVNAGASIRRRALGSFWRPPAHTSTTEIINLNLRANTLAHQRTALSAHAYSRAPPPQHASHTLQ